MFSHSQLVFVPRIKILILNDNPPKKSYAVLYTGARLQRVPNLLFLFV